MPDKIVEKINHFNQVANDKKHLNCIVSNLSSSAKDKLTSFDDFQKKGRLYGKTIAIKDNININNINEI